MRPEALMRGVIAIAVVTFALGTPALTAVIFRLKAEATGMG
jgi:hypothetical protein